MLVERRLALGVQALEVEVDARRVGGVAVKDIGEDIAGLSPRPLVEEGVPGLGVELRGDERKNGDLSFSPTEGMRFLIYLGAVERVDGTHSIIVQARRRHDSRHPSPKVGEVAVLLCLDLLVGVAVGLERRLHLGVLGRLEHKPSASEGDEVALLEAVLHGHFRPVHVVECVAKDRAVPLMRVRRVLQLVFDTG